MTPIIPSLSPLFEFLLPRNISGTDFGTGYGGTVCGFHTRPIRIGRWSLPHDWFIGFQLYGDSFLVLPG